MYYCSHCTSKPRSTTHISRAISFTLYRFSVYYHFEKKKTFAVLCIHSCLAVKFYSDDAQVRRILKRTKFRAFDDKT